MSKTSLSGKAAIAAGAIGSAAIAAALLYTGKRRHREPDQPRNISPAPHTPTGEAPQTD